MNRTLLPSFCVLLSLALAGPAAAAVWTVRPDGTGDFPTIQAALNASRTHDVILLTDGTFRGEGNRDLDPSGKDVTLRSQSGDPRLCVIDCEASPSERHRGFRFHSGEGPAFLLDAVTIQNGNANSAGGGGIYCGNGSSPTLTRCVVTECTALENGGGMRCTSGASPYVRSCTFKNNLGGDIGGGGAEVGSTGPTFEGCAFVENEGSDGGAVHCSTPSSPAPRFTDCVFYRNHGDTGGAMNSWGGSPLVTRCLFRENSAGIGGAFFGQTEHSSFVDCRFVDNSADFYGGGLAIYGDGSTTALTGCTLDGNRAANGGGAIAFLASGTLTLERCTLASNLCDVGSGIYLWESSAGLTRTIVAFGLGGEAVRCEHGSSPQLSCCDLFGNGGGDWVGCLADQAGQDGNISLDPLFCQPEVGNYALNAASPCAPFTPPNPECDQIGAWPVGCGTADMGACCLGHEYCRILSEEDCLRQQGIWQGGATDCTPNPCPATAVHVMTWGRIKEIFRSNPRGASNSPDQR